MCHAFVVLTCFCFAFCLSFFCDLHGFMMSADLGHCIGLALNPERPKQTFLQLSKQEHFQSMKGILLQPINLIPYSSAPFLMYLTPLLSYLCPLSLSFITVSMISTFISVSLISNLFINLCVLDLLIN